MSIAQRGSHRGWKPPLSRGFEGGGAAPREILFGPYIRLGEPTYGFWSMVLDVMAFGQWYWMFQHVYICIVTLKGI